MGVLYILVSIFEGETLLGESFLGKRILSW